MWVPTAWAGGAAGAPRRPGAGPLPPALPPEKEPFCGLHELLSPPHTWHASGTCCESILPSQPNVCTEGRAGETRARHGRGSPADAQLWGSQILMANGTFVRHPTSMQEASLHDLPWVTAQLNPHLPLSPRSAPCAGTDVCRLCCSSLGTSARRPEPPGGPFAPLASRGQGLGHSGGEGTPKAHTRSPCSCPTRTGSGPRPPEGHSAHTGSRLGSCPHASR